VASLTFSHAGLNFAVRGSESAIGRLVSRPYRDNPWEKQFGAETAIGNSHSKDSTKVPFLSSVQRGANDHSDR
jgi:hypothetical protein